MAQPSQQSVSIVDAAGGPAEGAVVVVERGSAPYPEIARRTGASGKLTYALPDGEFELAANHPDGRSGRGRIVVKGGASPPLVIRIA